MISIVVPVYKVEKYLHRCVDSILAQTFKDFELILVDDGSPDRCGEICDEYALKDDRIRVVHQENQGLSVARNVGIELARGEYIGFVDSDDYIHQDMYHRLYEELKNSDASFAMCDYYIVNEDLSMKSIHDFKKNLMTPLEALPMLNSMMGFAWNKLYKKNIFKNLRYPPGRIYEDGLIAHKIFYFSDRIIYIPDKLYYYFQSSNSITRNAKLINKLEIVNVLCERINFYEENNMPILIKDTINRALNTFIEIREEVTSRYSYSKEDRKKLLATKNHLRSMLWKYRKQINIKQYLFFEAPKTIEILHFIKRNIIYLTNSLRS